MKKIGLKIKTTQSGGRYQHEAFNIGINVRNRDAIICGESYYLFEKAMERLYDELPEGSKDLELIVKYKRPKSP